ncbi:glycosyltransferase [Metabacillus bambusae]|uniref:Glycosyltransferase n=1 Tax=Metabacillus bambusae TaxID=2795218 RepID=A0ABS3N277_9BACI|nr:glycosyltransferase [Metabacillus bambusae]MBO1512370.1 glycosyltransferase [Metabacillus bambusae]
MKKRVAFYIESMVVGGAEKVLIDLVNNLNPDKYEVTVITLFKKSIYSDYYFQFEEEFRHHVQYKHLIDNTNKLRYQLFNYLYAHIPKSKMYRYLIKDNYDVEVAFYEGWPTEFVSFSSQKSYKLAWLHTNQSRLYQNLTPSQIKEKKRIYQSFDQIVGVSNDVCQSFKFIFPKTEPQCVYNPLQDELIYTKAQKEEVKRKEVIQFVTVGRLISVKGYERLISALAECKREGYSFGLWMIGEGENRDQLKEMVKHYHMEKEIQFLGQKSNPYPYIKAADCMICSSYSEGLSTVVIESIILRKPVITTDCSGMQEIFGSLECGYICENSEEGLLKAIKKVLEKPNDLEYYHKQAQQRSEFFSIKNRMADVEKLLEGSTT